VTFTYENIRDGGGDCYELATSWARIMNEENVCCMCCCLYHRE
jgi:hypothetical protein